MKSIIMTVAVLLFAPACVTSAVEPGSEEVASNITATEEEESGDVGAARDDTTPVLAPSVVSPGSCASCGPGPQPWQGAVWLRPNR